MPLLEEGLLKESNANFPFFGIVPSLPPPPSKNRQNIHLVRISNAVFIYVFVFAYVLVRGRLWVEHG